MPFGSDASVVLIVGVMFGLMALGVPIFIAIGIAALGGLTMEFGLQQAMTDFTSFLWQSLNSFELVTIPLFVLAAMLVENPRSVTNYSNSPRSGWAPYRTASVSR